MTIHHLPRLLANNVHSMVMSKQRHIPGLLPRMLQSCIFHLSRINSLASPQDACLRYQGAFVPVSIRMFSCSSSVTAMKRPPSKAQSGAGEEICQVFDTSEMLVGQMTIRAAEALARKDNLRLVDMGVNSDHLRSFKMMSGRELAEEGKRLRTEKKSDKVKEKEFRVTSNITDHDLEIKTRQAKDVLTRGGQVKFVIKAHRRSAEAESNKMISQLMKKITTNLQDCAVVKQGVRTQTEQQLQLRPLPASQQDDSP